jgi:hypothetical protein
MTPSSKKAATALGCPPAMRGNVMKKLQVLCAALFPSAALDGAAGRLEALEKRSDRLGQHSPEIFGMDGLVLGGLYLQLL